MLPAKGRAWRITQEVSMGHIQKGYTSLCSRSIGENSVTCSDLVAREVGKYSMAACQRRKEKGLLSGFHCDYKWVGGGVKYIQGRRNGKFHLYCCALFLKLCGIHTCVFIIFFFKHSFF